MLDPDVLSLVRTLDGVSGQYTFVFYIEPDGPAASADPSPATRARPPSSPIEKAIGVISGAMLLAGARTDATVVFSVRMPLTAYAAASAIDARSAAVPWPWG